jgi:outer membrane protein assembly factor BamB
MGRLLRNAGLVAAVVLALSGCWPVPGQSPDRTSHNPVEAGLTPATVGELTEAWTTQALGIPLAASDPVVSSAGVHFVLGGCGVATHRFTDGAQLWISEPSSVCTQPQGWELIQQFSPAFVVGDRLMWGWWGVMDNGPSPPPPSFFGGTSHHDVATGDTPTAPAPPGTIIAGVRGDTVATTSLRILTPAPPLPPVPTTWLTNGRITVGPLSEPAAGRTFDTTGGTVPTLGTNAVFQAGHGSLATAPGDPAQGQAVRAFALADPRPGCGPEGLLMECPLWVTPVDGTAATEVVIAPDQGTVYAGTSAGTVYALDAATGAVRWTAALGAPVTATPALADGTLYVPTGDGRLVVLAAAGCGSATCSPSWEASTGSPLGVQPAVAGGVVYAGSDDGSIDAFDAAGCGAATCVALWSAEAGSAITGAPAVSSGRLYVGTANGQVVAYRRP